MLNVCSTTVQRWFFLLVLVTVYNVGTFTFPSVSLPVAYSVTYLLSYDTPEWFLTSCSTSSGKNKRGGTVALQLVSWTPGGQAGVNELVNSV